MNDRRSAGNTLLVSRSAARSAIRDALRLYVGRGRRYSVKQLSNGTGVPDRLIECAIADIDGPDYRPLAYECLFSISLFLGAEFTSEWLRLTRQGAFDLPDEEIPPGALAADNAEDNATLTRAAIDGQFDEVEKPALRLVGHRMIERGQRLVAA